MAGLTRNGWQLSAGIGGRFSPESLAGYGRNTQISTGQRSALALSVFLALNIRVTGGPRLLLIDDPVAHVDDLNTLSFLDYLREIVVKNKRQVFFTTASRKLASLFEMKFSGIDGFPLEIHRLKR